MINNLWFLSKKFAQKFSCLFIACTNSLKECSNVIMRMARYQVSYKLNILLAIFSSIVFWSCTTSRHYGTRTVSTTFGVLRGELVSPGVNDLSSVLQFLGIPYGMTPSGPYRFNMAISAAKWTHMPKNATKLSSVCMQTGFPELAEAKALQKTSTQRYDYVHRLYAKLKPESEDCLYMNLFVPERMESRKYKLSVLVIVHGDEYDWNSGNPYNGTVLASFGQIIVVTLNYRLGAFGFLGRCESNSCSGNAGLSDIVAALKMLTNTLPAFDGDPGMITLLGWGSGAAMVSLLMASPITQPNNRLFRRAILLDGSALAPWALSKNPQSIFLQLAQNLNCFDPNKTAKRFTKVHVSVEEILKCMQEKDANNVTTASRKLLNPTFLSAFAPIIDGQMVPNKPRILFGAEFGSLFRNVDILLGLSSNPAHYLLSNNDLVNGIDKDGRLKIFRTLVRNLYVYHRREILAAIINEYTDWDNPKDHRKTIRNGVLNALNDVLFTAPAVDTARLHSMDDNKQTSNTFMFVFAHETKHMMNSIPGASIRGSLSGDQIAYILGYPLHDAMAEDKLYYGFNYEDKHISRVMMHYISNFVKSGDPSRPALLFAQGPVMERFYSTAWPQFNQATREAYLEISDRPLVKNYFRNAQVGFWNEFVPQLHSTGQDDAGDEDHNLLPNHFKKDSFFGVVRPFASHANNPFPPPPPPPTPIPSVLKKLTTEKSDTVTTTMAAPSSPPPYVAQNSTMLSVTVAVGCCLLFLNICIGFGLYRQCSKRDESKKKMQLHFQSYASNRDRDSDMNYGIHCSTNNNQQDPLISSGRTLSGSMRSGISPTCPKHGRVAMAMAQAGNNSFGSIGVTNSGHPLEEIQV